MKSTKQKTDVFSSPFKCARCGLCCLLCLCTNGREGEEDFFCKFLSFDQDKIGTCSLIRDDKVLPGNFGVGEGCLIQRMPEKYKYLKDLFKEVIEAKAGVR